MRRRLGPTLRYVPGRVRVRLRLVLLGRRQPLQGRLRLQPQVGADLAAALDPGDLVTAETAVLAHQVEAAQQLGRLLLVPLAHQVRHLIMTFQTARLHEAARQHGELPVVRLVPAVGAFPGACSGRRPGCGPTAGSRWRCPGRRGRRCSRTSPIGCGLLESTNRSSRGCDANCVISPGVGADGAGVARQVARLEAEALALVLPLLQDAPGGLQLLRQRLRPRGSPRSLA